MAKTRDRYAERAALEAGLKFGPQLDQLAMLLTDSKGNYIRTRRVNASNARGIQQATMQARPQVQQAFDTALKTAAALPGAPDQTGAFQRRTGEALANALMDLTQQGVRAQEAQIYGNDQAREQYLGEKDKIMQQGRSLVQQQGDYTAARYGDLKDDSLERALTRRGQDLQAATAQKGRELDRARLGETIRHNKASEKNAAKDGEKKTPRTGLGSLTQEQETAELDKINTAREWIKRLQAGNSPAAIAGYLITGQELKDASGNKIKVPQVPKVLVSAALDLEVRGGRLSQRNVDALHRRGVHVPGAWRPTGEKPKRADLSKPPKNVGGSVSAGTR